MKNLFYLFLFVILISSLFFLTGSSQAFALPPIVTITSPISGVIITTPTVTVTGTASDANGVQKVEVSVDSGPFNLASGTTSWSFVTGTLISGSSHTIVAKATSNAAMVVASTTSVTVGKNPIGVAFDPSTNMIYVSNNGSNTVSVIDGATNIVKDTIQVGSGPFGVAVNPSTNMIYVDNRFSNTVSVIDGATNIVKDTIQVGSGPQGVAVNPSTNTIYVTNSAFDSNSASSSVSVIDGATNIVKDTIMTGIRPVGVAVNPSTNTIYVSNYYSDTLSVIDGATNIVTTTIQVGLEPHGVAFDQSTKTVYVASSGYDFVSVINSLTNTATTSIDVGNVPRGVALDTSTNTIYVANYNSASVSVINGATNEVASNISVGSSPYAVTVNPSTNTAYVANYDSNTVSVITSTTTVEESTTQTVNNVCTSFIALKNGNWDDPATWGVCVPGPNDVVTIPSGITVTIPSGVSVTVGTDGSIFNSGTISNFGIIDNNGGIINNHGIIDNFGVIDNNFGLVPNHIVINNNPGDQYDSHVSGDWASYSSDLTIRYYNFATHTDAQIPLGSAQRDLLSDISGSKMVFSRVTTGVKTAIMIFDTSTPTVAPIEIDAASGSNRLGSAIGGNTVAYIDFGLSPNGELVIHDLITDSSVRITNDAAYDQNPSVSPDGNVVTWEHCLTTLGNCDIWQAVKSGSTWNVSVVSATSNPEGNPDTNANLVVYDSTRGGDSDIFWRPVTGGPEVQIPMPGYQANPSIAGNLILFESRPTLIDTSDLFVYDLITKRTYQITHTPLVSEQLNDITILPGGEIHVVWTSDEDGFDQRNVHAATLTMDNGIINNFCDGTINNSGTLTGNPITYSTCKIVFTSGTGQTLATNQMSNAITIQLQHTSGTPVNAGTGGISVSLSSTSLGRQFSLLQSPFTPITIVTIPVGSNSATLYYKDTISGSPTITASSGTLTSATATFTVTAQDAIPPDTTITSNPSSMTTSLGTTFAFTGSDNITPASNLIFECSIDGGTFTSCTSPTNYPSLATGSHSFQVRAIDQVGNVDLTPASFSWTIINLITPTTASCGTMSMTTDASGNTIITGTDSSGIITVQISLPPGTTVPSGTLNVQCSNTGANKIAQVSGAVIPSPPGKSVMIYSNNKFACIIDSPSIVSNPTCSATNTANSVVKMDCTINGVGNPVTQTFSGFPDLPTSRTYTCTQLSIGGNSYTKIDGLAFSTIIIDNTPPTITFTGSINNGNSFLFGNVPVAPTCSATDDLSGIDGSCTITGYDVSIGDHALTGTAKDGFGNVGTATITYHVLPWTIKGFYQPVDMSPAVNTIKNGQTVPMKFNVYKGTISLTDPSVATFSQKQVSCITGAVINSLPTTTAGSTSLRYDATSGQFIWNWQSPKTPGNCYDVTANTLDGSSLTSHFKLK